MVASYIGQVGEFCRDKETFNAYVERMEMFFAANNIVETTGTDRQFFLLKLVLKFILC